MSNFTRMVKTQVKFPEPGKNSENFMCKICNFVKFDIYFLGLPLRNFLGVITDDDLHL